MCSPQRQGQVRAPRFASPSASHAIGPGASEQWAGRPFLQAGRAPLCWPPRRSPRAPPLRIICTPGMVAIASLSLGLNGLALAWESVAVVVGALVVGLLLGVAMRAWTARSGGGLERERERELQSLRRIADELARASDVDGVVRALLDELGSLFRVEFVALAFVSDHGREPSGFLARSNGRDLDWWRDVRVDLVREPSGIASAVNDATGFAVYDATGSKRITPRLVAETGAKSAAFVPLIGDGKPIAVLSLATTAEHRAFTPDDLAVMQALASEGTIALERTRSALALKEALERERLMADIGRRLRSELDLQSTLR